MHRTRRDRTRRTSELLPDVGHLLVDAFLLEFSDPACSQVGNVLLQRPERTRREVGGQSFALPTCEERPRRTVRPRISSLTILTDYWTRWRRSQGRGDAVARPRMSKWGEHASATAMHCERQLPRVDVSAVSPGIFVFPGRATRCFRVYSR